MNYYPFHIGDYVSATRHLSWDEDAAYRRLLDVYYTHEEPLPLDERKVFRLVMAATEDQREAVRVVLDEFFIKTDSGWINRRADVEIVAMRELSAKQREKANKRWKKNTPTDGGSCMPGSDSGNAPGMPRHEQNNAAASFLTADAMPPTPTPTPTPENTALLRADAREADPPEHTLTRKAEITIHLREQGIDVNMSNPHLLAWVDADLTDDEMLDAVTRARERKPKPARISAGYLNCIVGDILSDRAKKYPAGASTPPGSLSSTKPNRGRNYGKTANITANIAQLAAGGLPPKISEDDYARLEQDRERLCHDGSHVPEPLDECHALGRDDGGTGYADMGEPLGRLAG